MGKNNLLKYGKIPGDEEFRDGKRIWKTARLIELSKDIPEFDLHLNSIDISVMPWANVRSEDVRLLDVLHHIERVNNANLNYPVLVMPCGYVCNGWHRIAKAILRGKETVKAKRFEKMPEPDEIRG